MNIDTLIGIAAVAAILIAAKLIDKPRRPKKKDKYLTRIENEFENSLNTFANEKITQMSTHYGLNIELAKLVGELNFTEVDENK